MWGIVRLGRDEGRGQAQRSRRHVLPEGALECTNARSGEDREEEPELKVGGGGRATKPGRRSALPAV